MRREGRLGFMVPNPEAAKLGAARAVQLKRAGFQTMTYERCSEKNLKTAATLGPEGRRARALAGWATRRASTATNER